MRPRLLLEDVDECGADRLALRLRVAYAREPGEKQIRSIPVHQRNVVVAAKHLDHFAGLAQPQQPGIDEDAGELFAYRLVQQHGRDG